MRNISYDKYDMQVSIGKSEWVSTLQPKIHSGRATQDEKKGYQGNLNVLEKILQELDGDDPVFVRLLLEKMREAGLEIRRVDGELAAVDVRKAQVFSDISSSHSYHSAIMWGKEKGVLSGYPDGSFKPDRTVNRAEFLKIVLEAAGADVQSASTPSNFPDVDEGAWYAPYVRYARKQGIVKGYPDGSFRPERTVNFAEALKMAYVALGVQTDQIRGEWYEQYLHHAQNRSVLFSNNVDVGSGMSRKDVVWIVWKLSPVKQSLPVSKQEASEYQIKGNISWDGKDKIYHIPGCGSYKKTVIDPTEGERWFCSEQEAISAGWRKASNCP